VVVPDYSLGINLKGTTIENLVRDRTNTNFFLIVGMGLLMLLVAWFGYKNIKREVELAQIKSDFVSNVSHELRTPLALINMFTETLSMGRIKNEDKRKEYYEIIQQETERLSKIVNKILNFSKIESGSWKYNFVSTEINCMVDKIYATYKFHIQNKGFKFERIKETDIIESVVDPEAISEAVINLLDNAVKYSGGGKRVILRTGVYDGTFFIEVEDEGIGIAGNEKKKIFDKFYRVASGDVHNTKGTGLGLTLVSHIVEAHKGEIILNSEIGAGSKFKLVFPKNQNKL
jgi:two-component system phosphate regulon sensor histidine kinase PhoR